MKDSLSPARGGGALRRPALRGLARRLRFRVTEDRDALWQRIVADPAVRTSADASPEPGPPQGPPLLAWRLGPDAIVVRHWSGPADAISPMVSLSLHREGDVTTVEAALQQPRTRGLDGRAGGARPWQVAVPVLALLAVLGLAYVVAGSALLWALPLLLLLFAIPSALVMLPALAVWNAESRRGQREALLDWLGRTFVPIALPPADDDEADPFR
ncbi:MAG: hypothetical protein K1X88_26375 [Nannocystaceae bacterium]|nr:hypothetical protein [Nannocystaceae bacterium]